MVLARIQANLKWLHPTLGHPVFMAGATFWLGGFLVFANGSAYREVATIGKLARPCIPPRACLTASLSPCVWQRYSSRRVASRAATTG